MLLSLVKHLSRVTKIIYGIKQTDTNCYFIKMKIWIRNRNRLTSPLTHVTLTYFRSLGCSQGGIHFRGWLGSIHSHCVIYSCHTEREYHTNNSLHRCSDDERSVWNNDAREPTSEWVNVQKSSVNIFKLLSVAERTDSKPDEHYIHLTFHCDWIWLQQVERRSSLQKTAWTSRESCSQLNLLYSSSQK